jgi:aryl-alcohol dehydrogenase-like predicted oxidoreductase
MIELIRAAVERGITFFDAAEVYGPFTNENSSAKRWLRSAAKWLSRQSLVFTSTLTPANRRDSTAGRSTLRQLRTGR